MDVLYEVKNHKEIIWDPGRENLEDLFRILCVIRFDEENTGNDK